MLCPLCLQLFRDCRRTGHRLQCSTAWIGGLFDWIHKLIVKKEGMDQLFVPLHHWQNSASLVALVQVVNAQAHGRHMFEFAKRNDPLIPSLR